MVRRLGLEWYPCRIQCLQARLTMWFGDFGMVFVMSIRLLVLTEYNEGVIRVRPHMTLTFACLL